MHIYDYIVVGGGSAGCTVTHRLVKAGKSVLMLEAGPTDDSTFIRMPGAFIRVIGTERTWLYETEPQAAANGRKMIVPQGRTLGGGSSVNAMIYIRGVPQDYDDWRDLGCADWGWDDVLPYFKKSESNERLSEPFHGKHGPLVVSDLRYKHLLNRAAVQAGHQAGYPLNEDFNGRSQFGFGFFQTTIRNAERGSTAATYLREVLGDSRLKVITDAHVDRVITENGAAVGIAFSGKSGETAEAHMREEVILTAGALATPKILQLSGIGPAEHLSSLGISVVRDLPAVGSNYHDHLDVPIYARIRKPISLLGQEKGLKAARNYLQYKLFKSGLLTSNVVEAGGFIDTSGLGRPDIQFHFLAVLASDIGREAPAGHGVCINPTMLHPKSRGTVRLRSTRSRDPILFDSRSLSAQEDVDAIVRGIKVAKKIIRQPALTAYGAEEVSPLGEPLMDSDEAMAAHVRRYAKTIYHPVGTARMGTGPDAVVDPATLRVHGVGRLRVCDASIMPKIVGGNTNAPTIMIAERCADFIVGRR